MAMATLLSSCPRRLYPSRPPDSEWHAGLASGRAPRASFHDFCVMHDLGSLIVFCIFGVVLRIGVISSYDLGKHARAHRLRCISLFPNRLFGAHVSFLTCSLHQPVRRMKSFTKIHVTGRV